jgi:hypothetical protein
MEGAENILPATFRKIWNIGKIAVNPNKNDIYRHLLLQN